MSASMATIATMVTLGTFRVQCIKAVAAGNSVEFHVMWQIRVGVTYILPTKAGVLAPAGGVIPEVDGDSCRVKLLAHVEAHHRIFH